ncbi:STAS domain-containing protein [Marispirochaeta sp.]|jgi:anti-sigma B factor antagonist|uniref:STAS domain-containing protein n=1 Tax=Marispirochaeta sp. TaxID=2038653 RepID=UPI0029C84D71|nr:STAS domain-containing protein [Marispirochaeta sp.]
MTTEHIQGVQVIKLDTPQIDALNSEELKQNLLDETGDTLRIVIDLSNVRFVDSSGLGVLLGLLRKMHEKGGRIAFCAPRPPVQALFRMVRLADIVTIYENRDDALAAVSA